MDFKGFPGLAGKTAIVTGSTQGLGADIARGLARLAPTWCWSAAMPRPAGAGR